jgi:predicted Fe-Mo cluster-binding NifX family protein
MRVATTATGSTLSATVDPRFGRCSTFVLVETDDMSVEAVDNGSGSLAGGAGIQAAQLLARHGARAVLTGNCGPNAHQTLSAAGIDVYVGCSGTVSEVVERFKSGQLRAATGPTVPGHAGMGGGGG